MVVTGTRSVLSHKKSNFLQHTEITGEKNHTIGTANCTEENSFTASLSLFFLLFDNNNNNNNKIIISFFSLLKIVAFF